MEKTTRHPKIGLAQFMSIGAGFGTDGNRIKTAVSER
jgi:hypothetical protein